ncbi:50S ribosomal protein L31 [Streptomyces fodineus]|uniref:50S ribosomal protein L31 n=1 Tax=Streptomyces fodineus TaxID=1904616 RepID=A0A1D7YK77_9ACTN|nr:50S ribosomal protein L31 [Streptomyces fodineus]AOR35749.1 50S ribosomal protein L31 [Streptomyces fodineus]
MKPGIHPEYRPVVFRDRAADHAFPFYTGTQRVLDTAGRVERFERRYGRGGSKP